MKKKTSIVMQLMELAFYNSQRDSWIRLNGDLNDLLNNIILLGIDFEPNDFKDVYEKFRGGHWFGANPNGHGCGEYLYKTACLFNKSAALSFENWYNRKPFIFNNNRLHLGYEFIFDKLYYRVTGFNKDNTKCNCVGYKNRDGKGVRTLLSFDNSQLLELRKQFKPI